MGWQCCPTQNADSVVVSGWMVPRKKVADTKTLREKFFFLFPSKPDFFSFCGLAEPLSGWGAVRPCRRPGFTLFSARCPPPKLIPQKLVPEPPPPSGWVGAGPKRTSATNPYFLFSVALTHLLVPSESLNHQYQHSVQRNGKSHVRPLISWP